MSEWQPIETAPENVRILVAHWFHNSHMGIEIKQKARGEFIYPSRYYRPVAWMHLPDLPAAATAGRGG